MENKNQHPCSSDKTIIDELDVDCFQYLRHVELNRLSSIKDTTSMVGTHDEIFLVVATYDIAPDTSDINYGVINPNVYKLEVVMATSNGDALSPDLLLLIASITFLWNYLLRWYLAINSLNVVFGLASSKDVDEYLSFLYHLPAVGSPLDLP